MHQQNIAGPVDVRKIPIIHHPDLQLPGTTDHFSGPFLNVRPCAVYVHKRAAAADLLGRRRAG